MRPMPGTKPLYAAVLACAAALAGAWLAERYGLFEQNLAAAQSAIGANCIDCHDEIGRSGDLVLDPATLADVGGHAEVWEKVLRKITDRAMPPPDEPRPPERRTTSRSSASWSPNSTRWLRHGRTRVTFRNCTG